MQKNLEYPHGGSCARYIVSLCFRSLCSFNQIALTVFNLQSGQKMHLVTLQGEYYNLKNKHVCKSYGSYA